MLKAIIEAKRNQLGENDGTMDLQFEKNGRSLVAIDAGWKDSGYSVYEILAEDGTVIDTVMVHPLDDIASTIAEWRKV